MIYNYSKFILSAFVLLTVFGSVVNAITRGDDELVLVRPEQAQEVSGVFNIQWLMRDIDQEKIPFQIDIFKGSCQENGQFLGIIADQNARFDQDNTTYRYAWPTGDRLANQTLLEDGQYCLRICGIFVEVNNYYSLCERQVFSIKNAGNNIPKITSEPENTTLFIGERFTYQVNAEDEDNDKLLYTISQSPEFLNIDSQTGLITSKDVLTERGSHTIKIVVTDGRGGVDEQVFTLTITDENNAYQINILTPASGTIFVKEKSPVELKWSITNDRNIRRFIISMSADAQEFDTIIAVDGTERSYKWDITELEEGNYYIKLQLETESGDFFDAISPAFKIFEKEDASLLPQILDIFPEDGAKITITKPEIGAKIIATEGAEIVEDNITVKLNDDTNKLECIYADDLIKCTPKEDLAVGNYKVDITIEDSNNLIRTETWFFDIQEENVSPINSFLDRIKSSQTSVILASVVMCLGLIVLIVPWMLYASMGKKNNNQYDSYNYAGYQDNNNFSNQDAVVSNYNTYDTPVVNTYDVAQFDNNNYTQEITPVQTENFEMPVDTNYQAVPQDNLGYTNQSLDNSLGEDQINMPSSYMSDEVPDWLKDFESSQEANSNPFDDKNVNFSQNDLADSQIHDDYGLALNQDDNNDK
jgi:hypothetical protein